MGLIVSDDEAGAVKSVAESAGQALAASRELGAFVAKTIGNVPEDLIGIAGGDWLHQVRRRTKEKLERRTAEKLAAVAPARLSEPSPSLVIPLLIAGCNEKRAQLQELWASLLAAAIVDDGQAVRREYFSIVERLEPVDAIVLCLVPQFTGNPLSNVTSIVEDNKYWWLSKLRENFISEDDYSVSLKNLLNLDLISVTAMGFPVLTSFGRAFLAVTSL